MNHLTKVKYIQKLNEEELRRGIPLNASWHMKYIDSAYIYIGGFPYEITEGDLVIVFSQYGEIVDCRIVRDKETGKSMGFGFICYEDQRSSILAVDNLNGANICGRIIRVDHVEQFKIPKEYFETDDKGEEKIYKPSGPDGRGWGEDRILISEDLKYFEELKRAEEERDNRMNIVDQDTFMIDQDEMWEKDFLKLIDAKKESEIEEKLERKEKKRKKKEKKEKKKQKLLLKEEKYKLTKEKELEKLYKTYGITGNKN